MGILIYAPQVELIITTQKGTYDVSKDITGGQVNIQENTTGSMSFTLLNPNRKYDRLFVPDDTFEIYMTRLKRVLVMTGYLDTVPFHTVWPRTIQISGSDASKRLLFHYWDPGTQAALDLFTGTGNSSQAGNSNDGGLSAKAIALMTQVAGWDASKIHISSLPTQWLANVQQLYNEISPDLSQPWATLGGSPTTPQYTTTSAATTSTTPATTSGGPPPTGAALPASLALPTDYSGAMDIQPQTSPYYAQMKWGYQGANGAAVAGVDATTVKNYLASQLLMVTNTDNNIAVVVTINGWGPSSGSAQIGLSTAATTALKITSGSYLEVAFVAATATGTTPGIYTTAEQVAALNTASSSTASHVAALNAAGATAAASGAGGAPTGATTAINYCIANLGVTYVFGGGRPIDGTVHSSYDCSSYVGNAWYAAYGGSIGDDTGSQYGNALLSSVTTMADLQPGDLIYYGDGTTTSHVVMWAGNNQVYQAPYTGTVTQLSTYFAQANPGEGVMGMRRVSKTATGAAMPGASGAGATASASGTTSSTPGPITVWDWFGEGIDPMSALLVGPRALLNDTPLLPMIQTIMQSSLRSWMCAPNGDFIGWFPDYFGQYSSLAVMTIENIELQDFTIMWSDLNLVTHQFTAGAQDAAEGGSALGDAPGGTVSQWNEINTNGVCTVEFPQVLKALLHAGNDNDAGFLNPAAILNRFGARPNYVPMGMILSNGSGDGHIAEFWYAVYLFQQNWSQQFSATVTITFMPELYPGMLLQIPSQGFQCYVEQVTHNINMSQGGGFTTTISIMAPSATDKSGLYGLPSSGSLM